jgi:hypothetical protein
MLKDIKDPNVRLLIYKEALDIIEKDTEVFGLESSSFIGLCLLLPCIWNKSVSFTSPFVDNDGKVFKYHETKNYFPEFGEYYPNTYQKFNIVEWRKHVLNKIIKKMENKLKEESIQLDGKSIATIANMILKDWRKQKSGVYFGAKPYLQAMLSMNTIDDNYGQESGRSIINYFLANAGTWRGEEAKRIKLHLKKLLK